MRCLITGLQFVEGALYLALTNKFRPYVQNSQLAGNFSAS